MPWGSFRGPRPREFLGDRGAVKYGRPNSAVTKATARVSVDCHQTVIWRPQAAQTCLPAFPPIPRSTAMTHSPLRKIRMNYAPASTEPSAMSADVSEMLKPGEWFVEQGSDMVKVFSDPLGNTHVADLGLVDFLDGLARREIVFI